MHGFKIVEILIFRLALRMPIVILHEACHHAMVCVALQARVMKVIINSLIFKFIRLQELEQKGSCDEVLSPSCHHFRVIREANPGCCVCTYWGIKAP